MSVLISRYKNELLKEIDGLSSEKLRQILDFVSFIKARDIIDPSQFYFWTKKWQKMEVDADNDKIAGNVIGDGTLNNLSDELKK